MWVSPGKGAPVALGMVLLIVPFREDSKSLDLLKDRACSPLCFQIMEELPGCPGEPQRFRAGKHPLAPNLSLRACGQPDSKRFLALSYALWCQVIRSYPVSVPTVEMGFGMLPNPPGSSPRGTLSEWLGGGSPFLLPVSWKGISAGEGRHLHISPCAASQTGISPRLLLNRLLLSDREN